MLLCLPSSTNWYRPWAWQSNGSLLIPAGCLHPKTEMSTVPCGPYDYGCIQTYHYPTGSMSCFLLKIEFKQCLFTKCIKTTAQTIYYAFVRQFKLIRFKILALCKLLRMYICNGNKHTCQPVYLLLDLIHECISQGRDVTPSTSALRCQYTINTKRHKKSQKNIRSKLYPNLLKRPATCTKHTQKLIIKSASTFFL